MNSLEGYISDEIMYNAASHSFTHPRGLPIPVAPEEECVRLLEEAWPSLRGDINANTLYGRAHRLKVPIPQQLEKFSLCAAASILHVLAYLDPEVHKTVLPHKVTSYLNCSDTETELVIFLLSLVLWYTDKRPLHWDATANETILI